MSPPTSPLLPLPASRAEILRIQSARKRVAFERAKQAAWYRGRLDHIDADRLDEPEVWQQIPIVDKDILRQYDHQEFVDRFSIAPAAGSTAQVDWATSTTGQSVLYHGQSAASLLPRDDDVVLVLPPRAVSWHRLALPKVGSARLRAVLDGLLEDRLLTDTIEMHFALEPGGRAGQTVWVAACERAWLRSWLQALETACRPVSRIVPSMASR